MVTAIKAKQILPKLGSQGQQLNFTWKGLESEARRLISECFSLKLEVDLEASLGMSYLEFYEGRSFPQSPSSGASSVEGMSDVRAKFCKIRGNQTREVLGEELCSQGPACGNWRGSTCGEGAGRPSTQGLGARAQVVGVGFLEQEATRGLGAGLGALVWLKM